MSTDNNPVDTAIALLSHRLSSKRRSGAKRLRKLGVMRAGEALLAALRNELQDARTWETQYQMIMALGECGYQPALPFLEELIDVPFDATMIYVAVGDALFRLSSPLDKQLVALEKLISRGNADVADGAVRALAMLRLVPPQGTIEKLLTYVEGLPRHKRMTSNRRLWVTAAAPGWLDISPRVRPFLEDCATSENTGLADAASKALQGKYSKWNPL